MTTILCKGVSQASRFLVAGKGMSRHWVESEVDLSEHGTQRSLTAAPLDSLEDLLASKMVALVERGAPRDFRDIYALCHSGLTTPTRCWQVWRQRQRLTGSDTDSRRAQLAIETHLARIALHRPLDEIPDPEQRAEAKELRAWFAKEFVHAHLD
jgi:hypothetical protein